MTNRFLSVIGSLVLILFLYRNSTSAQKQSSIQSPVADNFAKSLLKTEFYSVKELSDALTQSFNNDSEKVRSIFIWITHTIDYDVNKRIYFTRVSNDSTQTAIHTLRERKAVCEGYANLFKELCAYAGIKAEFVGGYSRNEDDRTAYPHAWNAAFINGEWKLFDPTWASGGIQLQTKKFNKRYDNTYFMINPEKLVVTHYPDDPMWQLLYNPVSRELFEKKSGAFSIPFSYNDTISSHYNADSLTRARNEISRMIRFDPGNEIYRQQLNYLNENIEVDKMNAANELANDGITLLNNCARLINDAKRKRSTKIMNDNEKFLKDNINLAKEKFNKAITLYKDCRPTLQENKTAVRNNLSTMERNLEAADQNKKYLDNYFGTPKASRIKVL